MRSKINRQSELNFHPSNLQVTNEYYEKYETASTILDENPKILDLVHSSRIVDACLWALIKRQRILFGGIVCEMVKACSGR